MKRNLITAAALMVTAFFVATTIAQAADVNFGGEILTRFESSEHTGTAATAGGAFDDDGAADDVIQSRIRLDANVNVNDSTSAFIQLNSNRTWGENITTTGRAGAAGDGNGSFTTNDQDASVGITQAYFTLKNFANLPVDVKAGKQQIILDGHRLFGNTIWTMGQQNHDAIRFTHKHDNIALNYAWIIAAEDGNADGTNIDDRNDIEVHVAHASFQGILGGTLTGTYAYVEDGCGSAPGSATATCSNLADDIHTIGFRQAGQLYGIDYRGEYYYQWGDATATAQTATTARSNDSANRIATSGVGVDREAYMFGVRIGKAFNNVGMKPSLTVWYDYLSGTSDSDLNGTDAKFKSFNTLFDTGHKFYGLMDSYLGVGTGSSTSGTAGLGLQDVAIKAKLSPMPGWTLKADYHWLYTAEGVNGSPDAGLSASRPLNNNAQSNNRSSSLGQELDISLHNKYNANTTVAIGYSNYQTTAAFRDLRNVVGDDADWAYVQFDVKF
jgi:hypothetical protein